jgi:hypothetical protein
VDKISTKKQHLYMYEIIHIYMRYTFLYK